MPPVAALSMHKEAHFVLKVSLDRCLWFFGVFWKSPLFVSNTMFVSRTLKNHRESSQVRESEMQTTELKRILKNEHNIVCSYLNVETINVILNSVIEVNLSSFKSSSRRQIK